MTNLHHLAGTGSGRPWTRADRCCRECLSRRMVTAVLADTAGASGMLQGGVVAYQNSVKAAVLGVSARTAGRASARSTATSPAAMAAGVRSRCSADIGGRHHRGGRTPSRTTARTWGRS